MDVIDEFNPQEWEISSENDVEGKYRGVLKE
jgi:hypothetical protein